MFQTAFVDANGQRFEVLEAGGGDRLAFCLHGFPDHALSWQHQIPVLAGLIDASGASEVVLIGHDWGAAAAWCFAALRVRPLRQLVVMNVPHPLCFRAALRHWRQKGRSWYILFFQFPRLPERMPSRRNGAVIRAMFRGVAVAPAVMATPRTQIAEPGAATAMLNWHRAARRFGFGDARSLAQPITVPTLVIWGEDDVALDLICLDATERYVSDLRTERLRGISHRVRQHAPERVNALLAQFLSGEATTA